LAAKPIEPESTRAMAQLPGLQIEIVHRRPADNVEQISINLQATPAFDAFGRFFAAANPWAFWLQAAQLMWQPWLHAAGLTAPPHAATVPLQPLLPGAAPAGTDDDA
jgi:hypothetical protein